MWTKYINLLKRWHLGVWENMLVGAVSAAFSFTIFMLAAVISMVLPDVQEHERIWRGGLQHSVTFSDINGNFIGRRGVHQEEAVALSEMPRHLVYAVLATEDRRFFDHRGVDMIGIARAMAINLRAERIVQGGSTITQQLAKNIFLSSQRTIYRKLQEVFLALWIEARLNKEEILSVYLNRVYLGAGTYGVEAAARRYFGKSVRDIDLLESAVLAGLLKAPSKYSPAFYPMQAKIRANEVLDNMVEAGYLTVAQIFDAKRRPTVTVVHVMPYSADYFVDWVYNQMVDLAGKDEPVLHVRTTLDLAMQKQAEHALKTALDRYDEVMNVDQGAVVVMTPGGAVRAMVGGRNYEQSQFNRAVKARRQPGSVFKPVVYLAALEAGMTPSTIVIDAPVQVGNWSPKNYKDRYRGAIQLRDALKWSVNSVAVRLYEKTGRERVIDAAYRLGIHTKIRPLRSVPLGTEEVTVLEMTNAYATLANGGLYTPAYGIEEIQTAEGVTLYDRGAQGVMPERVVQSRVVRDLNGMMKRVVSLGTGRRAQIAGQDIAGKTGTTQNSKDAWFIGFTPELVAGVWFGNDNATRMNKEMTGGRLPAVTWRALMMAELERQKARPISDLVFTGGDTPLGQTGRLKYNQGPDDLVPAFVYAMIENQIHLEQAILTAANDMTVPEKSGIDLVNVFKFSKPEPDLLPHAPLIIDLPTELSLGLSLSGENTKSIHKIQEAEDNFWERAVYNQAAAKHKAKPPPDSVEAWLARTQKKR